MPKYCAKGECEKQDLQSAKSELLALIEKVASHFEGTDAPSGLAARELLRKYAP